MAIVIDLCAIMHHFEGSELASGETPGSGEDGPSGDVSPAITVSLLLIALAACTIGLSYYLWRRRLFRTLLSGGSVALLDNRVRQTTTDAVEGWHAFETPRFVPPLLEPRAMDIANSPGAPVGASSSPGFITAAREQEAQAQDLRPISVVEFLETEELEDDCSSSIPRALSVNLPSATAVESRYAIYSLRELPCVTAEEIQEI